MSPVFRRAIAFTACSAVVTLFPCCCLSRSTPPTCSTSCSRIKSWLRNLRLTIPSRDHKRLARYPTRIRGSEEHCDGSNVRGLPDTSQWSLRLHLFAEIALGNSRCMKTFCLHHSSVQGVDADLARPKFLRQRLSHGIHRGLGRAVDRTGRRRRAARQGTDVNDAAASGTELLDGFLRREDETEDIDVELSVEVLFGDVFERDKFVNAGVVDENIQRAERLLRLREQAINVG